jgi:undecaprenyl diphosphate synthase
MGIEEQITKEKLPRHIAVIMDGNGRWAKKKGVMRLAGHKNGVKAVRETTEACAELGIGYLTLYSFSTENWHRPKAEIEGLMNLLSATIESEEKTIMENNVRLNAIGQTGRLSKDVQTKLKGLMDKSAKNNGLQLNLALSYSGRWDITNAIQRLAKDVKQGKLDIHTLDEKQIAKYMSTAGMPDPELLIRTSGEMRVSNFLLWQIAYTEMHVTETLWPDFRKGDLYKAIIDYQQRERRFGKTSEQLINGGEGPRE